MSKLLSFMDQSEFEQLVKKGIEEIPLEFRQKLDNVAIFVSPYPNHEQQMKINLRPGWTLFGLYEGVPLTKRGTNYAMAMPDRITIFQGPIQNATRGDVDRMRDVVKNTVWHEIAHHFGMDENEVREAERKRGVGY
ncbi:MAG TPA: metallopeptidase family protein [Candidatus Dojkabacteria bacterium]|nr:metallopeptidase family protein [Candidatus Dojkabacteria bacterium]HRP37099.1 metallopeptidase family protein [Candidatus Dojkabacteria bacterium]HRP51163.1 metallopeptidase family protein [Candidatus Dojkabacteria bacterium]